MALSIYEQIIEYIKDSRRVVIALDRRVCADNLGSAYALSRVLQSFEKSHQITIEKSTENFNFLTNFFEVTEGFKQARRLVVTLDISEQGLDKFYYTIDEDKKKLEIFIVPKSGFFNPDDVKVGQGGFEYDLIITVGASDLASLGSVYQNNTAFFHETPIINIDYKANNEKFGEINLIEPTKSSVSEIIFDFLETNFKDIIDEKISTALLAGILEKTQSFKVPTLAPQTLDKASRLMSYKADRELVVRELFYNKSLSLVKLWGRVLARLKEDKENNLYWSLINTDDYIKAGANPEIINKVFDEVLSYLPRDAVIVLFSEFNGSVQCLVYSGDADINPKDVFSEYKVSEIENGIVIKMRDKDLLEAENEVVSLLKK